MEGKQQIRVLVLSRRTVLIFVGTWPGAGRDAWFCGAATGIRLAADPGERAVSWLDDNFINEFKGLRPPTDPAGVGLSRRCMLL